LFNADVPQSVDIRRCALRAAVAVAMMTCLVSAAGAAEITLAWDANPEPVVRGYRVSIRSASGVETQLVDVGSGTTYTFTAAVPGVTYYFAVAAYSADNTSPWSPAIAARAAAAPAAPALFAPMRTNTSTTPAFSWNAVSGADKYMLWVNDATQAGKVQRLYAAAEVGCATASTCSITSPVALSPGNASWGVRASNGVGDGPWSAMAPFTVTAPPATPPLPVPVPPVPVPPVPVPPAQAGPIPQGGWKLRFVDSEETFGGTNAIYAFDGNPNTFWHTQWHRKSPRGPHEIQIDLGRVYSVSGFRYLPRQDASANGRIAKYEFYVSTDGVNWGGAVATGALANNASQKDVRFTATVGRYIRLRALTEVNGSPWASAAELNVFGDASTASTPRLVPRDRWTVHAVDSQETNGYRASYAFDGDPATFWHTQWRASWAPGPHHIQIDMGAVYSLTGFRYLPRQDSSSGRIGNYQFAVSMDGVNWGVVASGTLSNDGSETDVRFAATAGRYIRVRALTEVHGYPFTAVAELNVFGDASTPSVPELVPQRAWKLVSVNSEDTNGYRATYAFDGNPTTFWHTQWRTNTPPPPHDMTIDMGASYSISGFRYLPRQDRNTHGRVARYEFYVSADGFNWGPAVATGTLVNRATAQDVRFTAKTGRFIRIRALSEVNGRRWASMAELNVFATAK
jgi:hypothetical protein